MRKAFGTHYMTYRTWRCKTFAKWYR